MKKLCFLLLVFLMLISCQQKSSDNKEVLSIDITSPLAHQVAKIEDFSLDSIWFEATYKTGDKQQYVLEESMLSKADLKKTKEVGRHQIKISFHSFVKEIELLLYDQNSLLEQHIFCLNNQKICLANSIYELEIPNKDGYYFYNWYLDEDFQFIYDNETNNTVISLYANYSLEKTYRVRFFQNKILLKEEYVKEGNSATPPIMYSYDDYVFSHWDKSFSNIIEDTDIHSIYETGVYEVLFYDLKGEVASRQLVKKGEAAVAPLLSFTLDDTFVGWNQDFSAVNQSLKIYPVVKNQKRLFEIRFYNNSLDNFLYSEWIEEGTSINFNYKIENYNIEGFSHSLKDLKENLNIIVYYCPIEYEYYIDNELKYVLPFYEKPPTLPAQQGKIGIWEEIENCKYKLIWKSISNYSIRLHTEKHGIELIPFDEFIKVDPVFFLGIKHRAYELYEWFYDEIYTLPINNFTELEENQLIYGKLNNNYEIDRNDQFRVTFNSNDKECNVFINPQNPYEILYLPEKYLGMTITKYDNLGVIPTYKYVFISSSANFNTQDYYIYNSVICEGAFVEEGNKQCYDEDGALFVDNTLYYFPITPKESYSISSNIKWHNDAFENANIKDLYFEEGIKVIENLSMWDAQVKNVHLPASLHRIENVYFGEKLNSIIFDNGSNLELLDTGIFRFYSGEFILPASVKALICSSYISKVKIPSNHPYLQNQDGFILGDNGKTLVAVNKEKNADVTIPQTIINLFYGCFNGLYINQLVLHSKVKDTMQCNGYSYGFEDEYNNFMNGHVFDIVIPNDCDMRCPPSIRNSLWYLTNAKEEGLLCFGKTLIYLVLMIR